jgi:hypothetical protein
MKGLMRGVLLPLAAALALAAASPAPAQQACTGDLNASGVAQRGGPALTFGITPAGEAGALGPAVPAVPDDPAKTLDALGRLRAPGAPFVLRLNRFFWSDGDAAITRFAALVDRYTRAGYPVELQLRYHPNPDQEGDIRAWVAFVRQVVDRFGPNPRVWGLQVTNEVNFTISPDSSDGAYAGARDALIAGVEAAHAEAARRHFRNLKVGFNWFYRMDPASESDFWGYLRDHGGPAFVRAVDWVGLDAYPGTFFPPTEPPGGHRDAMVNALSTLRCFLAGVGIQACTPIHVEENGWPTQPPLRSYDQQAQVLETMVRAVNDFRGTFNVTDYRWFDLRDHSTSSTNFQHHYGLLEDNYAPKPAFATYGRLVAELAGRR